MKRALAVIIVFILSWSSVACGQTQENQTIPITEIHALNYPQLGWGMDRQQVKENLASASDEDFQAEEDGFTLNGKEAFGKVAETITFSFRPEDQLETVTVEYPVETDMQEIFKALEEIYGPPAPEYHYFLDLAVNPYVYHTDEHMKVWINENLGQLVPARQAKTFVKDWAQFMGSTIPSQDKWQKIAEQIPLVNIAATVGENAENGHPFIFFDAKNYLEYKRLTADSGKK